MKLGIISVGFNRPELQEQSLKSLAAARWFDHSNVSLVLALDHSKEKQRIMNVVRDMQRLGTIPQHKETIILSRPERYGLSRNILEALREMFEDYNFDLACILEDDVIVSKDFIQFHLYCQEKFKLITRRIFTVSGYTKIARANAEPDAVTPVDWYCPDGVCFSRPDWRLLRPFVTEEFYKNPAEYFDTLYPLIEEANPQFAELQWKNGLYEHLAQAGLINAVRAMHRCKQLVSALSRCQDTGSYGFHQKFKTAKDLERMKKEMARQFEWHSEAFHDDYEWTDLEWIDS